MHNLHKQLSYHKGSCKRLKPQEMQVKVKQAVKKPVGETTRLGKKIYEQATASRQKLDEWKKAQMEEMAKKEADACTFKP